MRSIGLVFKKEEMIMVCLKQGVRDIFLEGYRVLPFLDFSVQEKEEALLHNLDRFLKNYRARRANIYIALPRSEALLQFLHLPLAVEEDLRTSIGYEIDRHTPHAFEDVYFDYHVVARFPESNLLYVLLMTIKREVVDYYLDLLKKIKVKPQGIEITTTALFNGFQKESAPGETLLDFSWIRENRFFQERVLKVAGRLAPRLAAALKPPEAAGEARPSARAHVLIERLDRDSYELNVAGGGRLHYSRVFPALGPEHEDLLFQEMHNNGMQSLIHLPGNGDGESAVRFVLAGTEMDRDFLERIPENIREDFSVMRRLPVRTDGKKAAIPDSVSPLLAAPVGLALKGLGPVTFNTNFIPPKQRARKHRSKRKLLAGALAVLITVSLGALLVKNHTARKIQLEILNAELKEYRQAVQEIEELQQEAEGIERFSAAINSISKKDPNKIAILEELTQIIPDDIWLTEFNYKVKGLKVKLSGYAVSASMLIPLLEESGMFGQVKFTSPITTDRKTNLEKFRLEMRVTPLEAE